MTQNTLLDCPKTNEGSNKNKCSWWGLQSWHDCECSCSLATEVSPGIMHASIHAYIHPCNRFQSRFELTLRFCQLIVDMPRDVYLNNYECFCQLMVHMPIYVPCQGVCICTMLSSYGLWRTHENAARSLSCHLSTIWELGLDLSSISGS